RSKQRVSIIWYMAQLYQDDINNDINSNSILTISLRRCQNFCQVYRLYAGPLAMEAPTDMHQAGIIGSGTNFSSCVFDMANLISQHSGRRISVLNCKSSAKTTALFRSR